MHHNDQREHQHLVQQLKSLVYFSDINKKLFDTLAQQAIYRHFPLDHILFLENEPSAGLWLIQTGSVKIYKLNPEGDEHILHLLGPGDSFNDISALDAGPNAANAATLGAVDVWILPSSALRDTLQNDIQFAMAVVEVLTQRIRGLAQQIEDLTLFSVTTRLARFLIQQMETPSLDEPGITRKAIAAHLATKPETISRSLRTLEKVGAIQFDRHQIVIINLDLLHELAMN